MSIIVTGGAGFIGSCVVRTLNDAGIEDIIIVDNITTTEKWMNMRNKKYIEYVHKNKFLDKLSSYEGITAIIHMGACSATTERDFDYLWNNNFEYTKTLWNYCREKQISFIYASSAATYGDGSQGFDDNINIDNLMPLNGYGYSKQLFDLWVKKQTEFPKQHCGLKFFNVYGPNEYFKGSMASMIFHGFKQIKETGFVKLFKSCDHNYADGGQLRDFVYIKDACAVIKWLLDNPDVSGLFNVGTGRAQSFRELAEATFRALDLEPNIAYIDMPEHLKEKYQYYTKAEMIKLRSVGYVDEFKNLEEGALDYVQNHLNKNFEIY
ncbi:MULTISPECIES: ADP-glyceromanno-heptose 6-epimerase [unclassified Clostridium]|uniref:ADP-glyceromanno-heptose 6-epimerase n=1 Tax=unclassified Clostridium TaxID=2614128 RepID=UPI00029811EE|nr:MULTISPECIES: ADP-glyceromanno-heptose 6-epimerase [unclassified Clostridium]EKQ56969.1 MAG: ADP-L-glycero-D-manno-heptose-6-epimerase [Clostridium sp. Maddingley MBC34-26]